VKHLTVPAGAVSPVFRAKDLHDDQSRRARADARLSGAPLSGGWSPSASAALALATPGLADGQGCSAALRFNLSP